MGLKDGKYPGARLIASRLQEACQGGAEIRILTGRYMSVTEHVEGLLDGGSQHAEHLERYLHTIDQNIKRINQLIEEMHNVTEIDHPDFRLHLSPVDVPAFIDEKARDYELLAQRKSITIALSIGDRRDLRLPVRIDAGRLAQILNNIMVNSIRFTPNAGLIAWDTRIEKDMLRMEIYDTGPGFAENDLLHVFQKFYQGDNSHLLEKGHAGLGPYIVYMQGLLNNHKIQSGQGISAVAVIGPRRQRKTQIQRMQTDP